MIRTELTPFEVPNADATGPIQAFKAIDFDHVHYDASYERIKSLCLRDGTSGVVILTGSTGAGKTHLARKLYADLRQRYRNAAIAMESGEQTKINSLIPVAGLRAIPPRAASFEWQDFFIRLLDHLRDVLVDKKLSVLSQQSLFPELAMPVVADSIKVATLRRCSERALRNRRTRVLIVDEAHHILMCRDKEAQKFAFEQLKSLRAYPTRPVN